jgi:hypothetical protein
VKEKEKGIKGGRHTKRNIVKKKEGKAFCFEHKFALLPFISSVTLS